MQQEKSLKKRLIPLFITIFVVLAAILAAAPTLARYIRKSDGVPNDFTSAGSINPSAVWATNEGNQKMVKFNVGKTEYPVYIRVEVIISWKSADGIVWYEPPTEYDEETEKGDYTIVYNSTDWQAIKSDNSDKTYYYYLGSEGKSSLHGVVISEGTTKPLITDFVDKATRPPVEGYTLNVEFIIQTVQAVGYTDDDSNRACEDAWGLKKGALAPNS